jgi:hypothetical protein
VFAWFRPRLTFANVVSMLALFIALAGGAYAAATRIDGRAIKLNSIPGNRLKARTVAGNRLRDSSITGRQVKESSLGPVPSALSAATADNANALGGLTPDSFQRHIAGGCSTALQSVDANGSPQCAPRSIFGLSRTVDADHGLNFGDFGDLSIGLSCGPSAGRFVRILLINVSSVPATLNWLYHDGSAMQASGTSLGTTQADHAAIADSNNGRIEGQFILASATGVTTLIVHAFKGAGSGCEISGTVVSSPA